VRPCDERAARQSTDRRNGEMTDHKYETKTAGGDISAAFDDFMQAFEAFK
jgi:hypothetical protein